MKKNHAKLTIILLIVFLFLQSVNLPVFAYGEKEQEKRSIAIVFDNSGSMYINGNTAWSRATYAMEVFASMLNESDKLSIYPMHPITIDGKQYDMNNPLRLNGPKDAQKIRSIFTENAEGTPVEAIQKAHEGLMQEDGQKWLLVLTDGDSFYKNDKNLGNKTAQVLKDEYLEPYSKDMNVIYLGIGSQAVKPSCTPKGNYTLLVEKVSDSAQVLSKLTMMCNLIFGRDTMPKSHLEGQDIDIDVSIGKLILFIQGEKISDVKLTGPNGEVIPINSYDTKYPENGVGGEYAKSCKTDKKLQGVMTTYTDLPVGKYTVSYSGNASNMEAYYEPDVDMEFTFTDENGVKVRPEDLYEGNYVISFGMKDAKTGEYTQSDLIGDTKYEGHYSINGETFDINCNDKSGSVNVFLKMDDNFNADMLMTFLSGYKIYKSSADFGWPDGGLNVRPRPSGDLKLVITEGQKEYHLSTMETETPFRAEVFYMGEKLTGETLEAVILRWDSSVSGAEFKKLPQGDHYEIYLEYKDQNAPENTKLGTFSVPVWAEYTPPASEMSESLKVNVVYSIVDNWGPEIELIADQNYYVMSQIEEGEPLRLEIRNNGNKLSPELLEKVKLNIDTGGIEYTVKADPDHSRFLIYLHKTSSLKSDKYRISCEADVPDEIGRTKTLKAHDYVTISSIPKWLKILAISAGSLRGLLLIWAILHIKALPTKLNTTKRTCHMTVDGDDVTRNTSFDAKLDGKQIIITAKYSGVITGFTMDVKPGKESYIMTPHAKRVAEVDTKSVKKRGSTTITEASIGSRGKFEYDEDTHRLVPRRNTKRTFDVRNGTTVRYSGTMMLNGKNTEYSTSVKLNFNKKK